jgi:hypothetical protein
MRVRPVQLLFALAVIALLAHPATAKPKIVSNGCTAKQIQSPEASECIDKMEADVLAGRSRLHAVYCSSSGKMLCCEYEGNKIVDHSCTVIGMQGVSKGDVAQPPSDVVAEPSPGGKGTKSPRGAVAPAPGGRAAEAAR